MAFEQYMSLWPKWRITVENKSIYKSFINRIEKIIGLVASSDYSQRYRSLYDLISYHVESSYLPDKNLSAELGLEG